MPRLRLEDLAMKVGRARQPAVAPVVQGRLTLAKSHPSPAAVAKRVKMARTPQAKAATEAATAAHNQAAQAAAAARRKAFDAEVATRFPHLFGETRRSAPVPLAIGIYGELCTALAGEVSKTMVSRFLAWWCGRRPYLAAVDRGEPRHNLAGEPVGVPSPEQIVDANAKLGRMTATR